MRTCGICNLNRHAQQVPHAAQRLDGRGGRRRPVPFFFESGQSALPVRACPGMSVPYVFLPFRMTGHRRFQQQFLRAKRNTCRPVRHEYFIPHEPGLRVARCVFLFSRAGPRVRKQSAFPWPRSPRLGVLKQQMHDIPQQLGIHGLKQKMRPGSIGRGCGGLPRAGHRARSR